MEKINIDYLSMSNIVINNPIINDSVETKREYINRLSHYIRIGNWNRRKYEAASLVAYKEIILQNEDDVCKHDIDFYKYFILLDFISILAFDLKSNEKDKIKKVRECYYSDFEKIKKNIVEKIFRSLSNPEKNIRELLKTGKLKIETLYLQSILENVTFKKKKPLSVMVTATMSAGKSTFINALVGKYVCLSQNMACTGKIHSIMNKAYEDGFSSEYDYDLVLTAGREELLNDNESNKSDKIVVSTSFHGELSNCRIVINDSPGVNYSGNDTHKEITDRLIKGKNFNLLLYVMNATQLGTNDESDHLDFVKRTIGNTPVIFIINKIDSFNIEEENILEIIKHQKEMLIKKGFLNPIVCPVSARAGYLAKQFETRDFTRAEERELYNCVDKFEQMKLSRYYDSEFGTIKVDDSDKEEKQLLKTCGLAYVEKIISEMCIGGSKNGSVIH